MKVKDFKIKNLISQITNEKAVSSLVDNGKAICYVGIDPTADSLTIGHFFQLFMLSKIYEEGNKCFVLLGDATAMIGDPTGKKNARKQLSEEEIESNILKIEVQCKNILFNILGKNNIQFVRNKNFVKNANVINFLSEIGKHFTISSMLTANCFSSRLGNGLTFFEMSYMLFQANDFKCLNEEFGVNLQIGGSDQINNALAGADLIRKTLGHEVEVMTFPLLTDANGNKIGKTEEGTIWIDKDKTSSFDLFQFFRNMSDVDAEKIIPWFLDENSENINKSKANLGFFFVRSCHGAQEEEVLRTRIESQFIKKSFDDLPIVVADSTSSVIDVILLANFADSVSDAFRKIKQKSIKIDDFVIDNAKTTKITKNNFVLSFGKKNKVRVMIKPGDE